MDAIELVLCIAARRGFNTIIMLLIRHGIDVNRQLGESIASSRRQPEIREILCSYGSMDHRARRVVIIAWSMSYPMVILCPSYLEDRP